MVSLLIPDKSREAAQIVEAVAGLVAAGRTDLAVAHVNTMLRVSWGEGWLAGMGEAVEIDRAMLDQMKSGGADA